VSGRETSTGFLISRDAVIRAISAPRAEGWVEQGRR
jgi:hypothetical protein